MDRRQFLRYSSLGIATATLPGGYLLGRAAGPLAESASRRSPAFSVIPVVGDGRWIWTEPPKDETGYLEPRPYSLSVGIELEGTGDATDVRATTPVPTAHPEQKIDELKIETDGCEAAVRELAPGIAQLFLSAGQLAKGEVARAVAHYKLTLFKQYQGFQRDQFPDRQKPPVEIRKAYLQDSPGIQTSAPAVRALAKKLSAQATHPWDLAQAFVGWITGNIRPQIGSYTSVPAALENRKGDCEEMAAVFVALCRSQGIPARLVWVPNHNWAEFYLTDDKDVGHWIPAHTAGYSWFGWTGAHELVIQKGDRAYVAEQHKRVRLLEDWSQWSGAKPRSQFTADLKPLPPAEGQDAGPGHRIKDKRGEWLVVGDHSEDHYMRR
jgi:transglutaminase superfamily protein